MGNFPKSIEIRFLFDNDATFPRYLAIRLNCSKTCNELNIQYVFANRFADKNHFIRQKSNVFCRKKGIVVAALIPMRKKCVWFSLNRIELSNPIITVIQWSELPTAVSLSKIIDHIYPFHSFRFCSACTSIQFSLRALHFVQIIAMCLYL